ncbi:MAG: aldehyde ferredoxin oxidoreductase family protein, partial [Promethearchaeota archaeon]
SQNRVSEEPLNEEYASNFLGGAGYCVRYLFDHLDKNTDPLSPDNILMFMTGPLCGSNAPTSGRFVVCAKSPLTGLWGESNCGGFFGPELKKAGYDGIIINDENGAAIKDATSLWGKGIFETAKILKETIANGVARVACIGPAGENLVKFATIASEDKAAGRTGMGAVMGSKKLKAIVVKAPKRKYEPADPESFKEAVKAATESINASFATQMFGSLGTSGGVDMYNATGELPIKYWTLGTWENANKISGATASETIFTRSYPCYSCPIGCSKKAKVEEGEFKIEEEIEAAEYETVAGFGSMILNDDLGAIQKANYLCNDYGIDTISGSSTIAFIYYLFNGGKINANDIDGLEPKWGDIKPALEMLRKIAYKEGIGELLAQGSNTVGNKFGIPNDEIATVYGMEVPYHDLRRMFGMAVGYALGTPRGPCHTSCDAYYVLLGLPFDEFDIKLEVDWYQDDAKMAEFCAKIQNYRAIYNSTIMCVFANPPPSQVMDLINTATGLSFNLGEFKILGERIYMMKRLFNLKMGVKPEDDRLPKILLNPVNEGGSAGKTPNFEQLKKAYYEFRTCDMETGYPSKEKLKQLGLDKL